MQVVLIYNKSLKTNLLLILFNFEREPKIEFPNAGE